MTIPTDAASVQSLTSSNIIWVGVFVLIMYGSSAVVGYFWKRDLWWKLALTFWAPFLVLYTTFFTNSDGFFTGVVGSLGYWLVQQGVQRGSQPPYYYVLIQIPVYEFLPALGLILALIIGLRRKVITSTIPPANESGESAVTETKEFVEARDPNFINTFSLLVWWSIISVISLSLAGERYSCR